MTTDPQNNPGPSSGEQVPEQADVDKNKIFAILAYLGLLFLVPLLAAKDSPFAKYHTNQGVVLFIAGICIWFPMMIIAFIPFINLVLLLLGPLFGLCIFAFIIIGIINAAQGKMKPLPLIGHFSIIK